MKNKIRMEDLPIYEITIDEDENQGIRMVSLVAEPAIETKGMFFSKNEIKDYSFKTIQDKQIVVGPAMMPNKKILRKDDNGDLYYVYFTPETIKKMVDKFLKDNNNRSLNVDHTNQQVNGFIQASWIVEDPIYDKSKFYGFNLPKGSWFIEVKIDDKEFWEKDIKEDGKFGFSIEGLMGQKLVEMNRTISDWIDDLTDDEIMQIMEYVAEPGLVHPNCKCGVKKGKYVVTKDACETCLEAKRQWEINGAFQNVFGTWYSKDIFGENTSIGFKKLEFEKISFDFDGTLSQEKIQTLAKNKIADGNDVYIITKRSAGKDVMDVAESIGIKPENVIFTNHKPKWSFIKDLGINTHYDNVNDEANEIEQKTDAKVITVPSNVSYAAFAESYNDYPKAATENAKTALRWAEKNGWGSCGTAVGKARANQLAKGESITRETIARMASFARHKQNSQRELGDGCGRLMWLAWGGDAGIEWAQRKLEQIDKEKFVVEPGEKESKDEFMNRCMGVEVGENGYDQAQAYAICISKWDNI